MVIDIGPFPLSRTRIVEDVTFLLLDTLSSGSRNFAHSWTDIDTCLFPIQPTQIIAHFDFLFLGTLSLQPGLIVGSFLTLALAGYASLDSSSSR
jgi:hypothetical protein